jgi:hypothetical protein
MTPIAARRELVARAGRQEGLSDGLAPMRYAPITDIQPQVRLGFSAVREITKRSH